MQLLFSGAIPSREEIRGVTAVLGILDAETGEVHHLCEYKTPGHRVGVLLNSNFGDREYLDVLGPRPGPAARAAAHGSCIAICATDAPVAPHQLRRLALRPLLGLARAGSYAAEGSGEIGLAFSTSSAPSLSNQELDPYFAAAYEAAREAVYNCLVAARPAERLDGTMQDAFPIDAVRTAGELA